MKTINVRPRYNYGWDISLLALCFYAQLATPKGATIGPCDFFLILVNLKQTHEFLEVDAVIHPGLEQKRKGPRIDPCGTPSRFS